MYKAHYFCLYVLGLQVQWMYESCYVLISFFIINETKLCVLSYRLSTCISPVKHISRICCRQRRTFFYPNKTKTLAAIWLPNVATPAGATLASGECAGQVRCCCCCWRLHGLADPPHPGSVVWQVKHSWQPLWVCCVGVGGTSSRVSPAWCVFTYL